MLLPIAVIGPAQKVMRDPDVHEMLVPYPGYEVPTMYDIVHTELAGDLMRRLENYCTSVFFLNTSSTQPAFQR